MDKRYEVFCLADRFFYETPDRLSGGSPEFAPSESGSAATDDSDAFPTARRAVPEGWRATRSGDWLQLSPVRGGAARRRAGRSTSRPRSDNAEKVAAARCGTTASRGTSPSSSCPAGTLLHLRNAKYAGRGASGKFVTIYPADERATPADSLTSWAAELAGEPGPYILSDLRWGDGPLYVRYGGFAQRLLRRRPHGRAGARRSRTRDGRLVPDREDPVFQLPDWVTLPEFLEPHLAARARAPRSAICPYRIEQRAALLQRRRRVRRHGPAHRRAGGAQGGPAARRAGRGRRGRGDPAGARAGGAGAARRAWAASRRCATGSPSATTASSSWSSSRAAPSTPSSRSATRCSTADRTRRRSPSTPRWALTDPRARWSEAVDGGARARAWSSTTCTCSTSWSRRTRRSVALLDFEAAPRASTNDRGQAVAHPGFVAPADRAGFDVDRYALACLRLALFVPMTTLLAVDRAKAAHLAEVVAEQFPVPREFLDEAVEAIHRRPPRQRAAPARARRAAHRAGPVAARAPRATGRAAATSMARGRSCATATPERDDRLFPGDIAQFADGGGLGLAHGAAGVLYALAETGAGPWPEARGVAAAAPRHPPPPAPRSASTTACTASPTSWTGSAHRERALELVDACSREAGSGSGPDLHGGLAGIGLALTTSAAATARRAATPRAAALRRLLADARHDRGREPGRRGRAGLMHGATGRRCSSCGCTSAPATRRCSTSPPTRCARTSPLRTRPHAAPCRSTRAGAPCPTSARAASASAWSSTTTWSTATTTSSARRRQEILPAAAVRYYAQPGLFSGARRDDAPPRPAPRAPGRRTLEPSPHRSTAGLARPAVPGATGLPRRPDAAAVDGPGDRHRGLSCSPSAPRPPPRASRPHGLPFLPPLPSGGPKTGPVIGPYRCTTVSSKKNRKETTCRFSTCSRWRPRRT